MAIELSDYLHDAYSDLPPLCSAHRAFVLKDNHDTIHDKLGPIFRKHHADEAFGLGLLHRHFDMTPDERLVQLNNISTPWNEADATRVGGTAVPAAWLFRDSKIVPYEFCFISNDSTKVPASVAEYPAFLEELLSALKDLGLQNSLGLRVHPGPDFEGSVEFTVGRANICVPPSTVSLGHTVEASFYFDPRYIERGYAEKCEYGHCEVN